MSINYKPLFIDTVAFVGKYKINQINLYPVIKEFCKLMIDEVAEYLKYTINHDISSICTAALVCGVKKVVVIPYYLSNGERIIFLRAYGGNFELFFTQIGLSAISKENNQNVYEIIEFIEDKYGVIIYNQL